MQTIHNFNPAALLSSFLALAAAFILGSIVGFERQYRQRTAGLRTNALVALGSAIFVSLAGSIGNNEGTTRVIAYVVSGIGFLGAGVIMREGSGVRGINTAATLWGTAAIGACAGAGKIAEAIMATLFVLAANTLLRPIVNALNEKPLDNESAEVTHMISVICDKAHQKPVMAMLDAELERNSFPAKDWHVNAFSDSEVEIKTTLVATSVQGERLDSIMQRMGGTSYVHQAFWSPSTTT